MNKRSAITMDRLSQLPQPVLHTILSLLSQRDAIQTSVLSKSWRYLWHGRLNVEFRDIDYPFDKKEEIWPSLDKTLQRYLYQNLSLHKFLVDIRSVDVNFALLRKWIPVLLMNMCVRSLNLLFSGSIKDFPLPLVVFQSESLVELHLQGCSLRSTLKSTDNVVMLKNLRTLHLQGVYITDRIFEKILSSCPLIENLDMLKCIGLKSIKLHKHHNIKDFGCSMNLQLIIEIEDPHALESLHIDYCCDNWFPRHKNMHFPHLKSLKLHLVQLPPEAFVNFSSFFPCLNELVLDNCNGLKEFRLLSSSIKRLTIKMNLIDPGKRIKAFIDTPNILYFEYSGDGDAVPPSIKFTTTSSEWKSKISLSYKLERSDFLKLNKLLKALSQSHITLKLSRNVFKKLHVNDSYGGFDKPVVVKHLKLKGFFSSSFDPVILNCFFRTCRPLYVHMDLYGGVQDKCIVIEYISMLVLDEAGPDLEKVSIEVWDMKAKEWHCVKGTSFPALLYKQLIRFRLTWKE